MRLIAALLLLQPPATTPTRQPPSLDGWRVGTGASGGVVVDTAGRATDAAGATLSVKASATAGDPASGFASVSAVLAADTLSQRRVRVSGEIRTRDVGRGAALWLRMDGAAGTALLLDNGMDDALKGTSEWTARAVVLPVPAATQRVVYGVLLQGGGAADVRRLRIEALPLPAADAPLGESARAVLDSALTLVRRYALWRDTVSWAVVEPEVRALARGAQEAREVYPAIRYLLSRLGDRHSFLQSARVSTAWAGGGAENPRPEVRALPANVGYVAVPSYSGGDPADMRAYAERVHASLRGIAPGARCGWVVDLRGNGGGNMYPMLAGLKPFLGSGAIGSFYIPGRPGAARVAGRGVGVEPPRELAPLEQAYVAVLTGPRTGSSGEVVTVAFRGRPRTRSFGAPTAGLTTGNARYVLPDGAAILLTTSVYVDRTGTRYGATVVPDQPVASEPGAATDLTLAAAVTWLEQASACGAAR